EVTNLEYAQFVKQTGHAPPPQWGGNRPPAGDEPLPVSNVTYDDAVAFAEWRSQRDGVKYRLPTEEEWEFAARNGDQANLYPRRRLWNACHKGQRYLPRLVFTNLQESTAWLSLGQVCFIVYIFFLHSFVSPGRHGVVP